jgi:DNA-directed RNA polymerase specialized sigma24 family protein
MLNELVKYQKELLFMAKKLDHNNFDDLLQDTYLKLHDSGKQFHEIDFAYIYFTMRSILIDRLRKDKEIPIDDFTQFEIYDNEYSEVKINLDKLTNVEKQLYYAYFGRKITNDKNEIISIIDGANLLKLSRETGIPYRTIYTRFQRIKLKLCKDLEMQSNQ